MDLPKPAPKSGGKGVGIGADNFLKVDDGEDVTVVFRGQPFLYYQDWDESTNTKQIFSEPVAGAKARYLWNAVIYDSSAKKFVAKVWDMANSTYELLYKINKSLPLETTKIQISRKGVKKNTRWTVFALGPIDEKTKKAIEAVRLNILHREPSEPEVGLEVGTPDDPDDEAPF